VTRALLLLFAGCTTAMTIDEYPCPPGGTPLTYDNFGAAFMDTNCNRCHNADAGYRHGAPEAYRFDTVDDVRRLRNRVFVRAAASNTTMPPGPEDPPADAREQLAEWLACSAP
jgi:uncharacterized membrane protein